jgi:hypothetical protein
MRIVIRGVWRIAVNNGVKSNVPGSLALYAAATASDSHSRQVLPMFRCLHGKSR